MRGFGTSGLKFVNIRHVYKIKLESLVLPPHKNDGAELKKRLSLINSRI